MEKDKQKPRDEPVKASTPDVLGNSSGPSSVDPRWAKEFRALIKARESLVSRQKDLLNQAAEEVMLPQSNLAEQGTDEYDRDWALSMASSEQEALYEIEEALNRIRTGTYGVCQATGKPIDPARLAAIPWTRFSAEAEQQLETEGQTPRARLGTTRDIPD